MKKFGCIAITMVILFGSTLRIFAQGTSNTGTDFWTCYMDHIDGAGSGGSNMDLYITGNANTTGSISFTGTGITQNFSVTANQVTIVTVPAASFMGDMQAQVYKGIHITSVKPIAIYAHIFALDVSGATLLLPVKALGKDYFSINYTQQSNSLYKGNEMRPSFSVFDIVATEDNTVVEITPSAPLITGQQTGIPFHINMQKGQVYQNLSATDLTGTRIRTISSTAGSCTKIAVFSGSSKISIGCGDPNATSDNLFQQVYPTASWGKNYITAPLKNRQYDIYRIVLSDFNTNVKLNGVAVSSSLFAKGYYEFQSTVTNVISADKPIQVVQYAVSQGKSLDCTSYATYDIGDPEMIYLTPIEQTIDQVTLYSTSNFFIGENFINVIIKTAAVKTFTLDGSPYTSFSPVNGAPGYSYAQIGVRSGTHNIKASDGFNAIAYGFGDRESYGYAAGTNLQDLNKYIVLDDPATNTTQTNGCTGVNYKLQLTLPYQTTFIKWDFKDGTTVYTDNNPAVKKTILKGSTTLYVYEYPKTVNYKAGDYTVVATVFNPVADDCGSNEDVELDYNIADAPKADFSISSNCLGDQTLFKDLSDAGVNSIKTWQWDFGDGQTSIEQNPTHQYARAGDYDVHLVAGNENGCLSDIKHTVHISVKPVAAFKYSVPDCAGSNVTFTDQTAATEKIVQWLWDYGDGSPVETRTDNTPFSHTYQNSGSVDVKLNVVLASGCTSDAATLHINITPVPVADFTMPDICAGENAVFTDKSTIADNTQDGFTYNWNFGDANASATNPNTSAEKNPGHQYLQPGNYPVTLTVTSKDGCPYFKTQTFTVNGTDVKASFKVENSNNLCSSNDVIFDDQSTVNFGNITKIVWYFDYNNNPDDGVVITKDQMPANHQYSHNYGAFNGSDTRNYAVVMKVYSGGGACFNISPPTPVTIKGNPIVNLSKIGSICQDADPVQIAEDKNGFTGTGTFSGSGVSSAGLFNPAAAGPGLTTVNYIFTAQNGCDYNTSQQITVMPSPKVSFKGDVTILEGSSVRLDPSVSGDGLTYQWVPSAGLDHDNVLSPSANPVEDTRYKLILTSAEGCKAMGDVLVKVLKYPEIPTAFTPNNDGINDTWNIKYLNSYPNNTVDIYDRYGEKLYSSVGYSVPWDGRYKGAVLPTGTYYYIINPKNGRKIISGSVTIIR